MLRHIVLVTVLAVAVRAQYGAQPQDDGQYHQAQQERGDYYNQQPTRPPIQILSHKQALNHDGAFKYGFAAENGLQQGESINPDGSRTGGYRYVDAHGKTISVKYSAGKEGFRILESTPNHVPVPSHPLPAPNPGYLQGQAQQPSAYQQQQSRGDEDDGSYKPQLYERPQPQIAAAPLFRAGPALGHSPAPQYAQPRVVPQQVPQYRPVTPNYNAQTKEPEYYDEPGKANSFGAGYTFEFAG